MKWRFVFSISLVVIVLWTTISQAQQLIWLEMPPGGQLSNATDVSADGRYVVGWVVFGPLVEHAVRWDVSTGQVQDLGTLGGNRSYATGISADGRFVVGYSTKTEDFYADYSAFLWDAQTGKMQELPSLPNAVAGGTSEASDISADGRFVVGQADDSLGNTKAVLWDTQTGEVRELGSLSKSSFVDWNVADAISPDGNFVVGRATGPDGNPHAVLWNVRTGKVLDLEFLGEYGSRPFDVSSGGRFVVGQSGGEFKQAVLWDIASKLMLGLGPSGESWSGEARGISADGRFVVGTVDLDTVQYAGLWDITEFKFQRLDSVFAEVFTEYVSLGQANAITPDGRYIVGNGGSSTAGPGRAFWLNTCPGGDTDQDYICDDWERNGIDINNDGTVDLDLPALGARVGQRDIFVEYDAMQGMAPSKAVIDSVVAAFRRAPDKPPFVLHVQNGGDLSIDPDPLLTIWQEFDSLKAIYFGTPAERASDNWENIRKARRMVFRYCLFAVQYDTEGSSGYAELPGDDFIVSLGHSSWQDFRQQLLKKPNPPLTWDNVVAGTFMHELGHTLGLRHGGSDHANYKPNFHSVMNYFWQIPVKSYSGSWVLDYSRQAFNTLNEDSLSEPAGIGGHAGHMVPIYNVFVREHGPVDWNQDGDTRDVNVKRDINADWERGVLSGYDDWANINLRHGIEWLDQMHMETIQRELTPSVLLQAGSGQDRIMEGGRRQELLYEIYQRLNSLNQPPSVAEVTNPIDKAVVSPTPTFVLMATDAEEDSLRYILELRSAMDTLLWQTNFVKPGTVVHVTLPDSLALAGGTWEFRVRAMDWKTALGYWSQWRTITVGATSVSEDPLSPHRPTLGQNRPDPFYSTTIIPFFLPQRTAVTLKVFDLFGREVAIVIDAVFEAGRHSVVFDASKLPDGVYIYQLRAGGVVEVKRMVLAR